MATGAWCLAPLGANAQNTINSASPATYEMRIAEGNTFLKSGKLKEAYQAALLAATENPKRFEAYALAAFILQRQGALDKAKGLLEEALARAPAEKRQALLEFQQRLSAGLADRRSSGLTNQMEKANGDTLSTNSSTPTLTVEPPPEARRKLDALMLIVDDADKARQPEDRVKLLREFMAKSAEFLELAPMQTNIWVLRAVVSVELDYPGAGWLAGRRLKEMGLEDSEAQAIRKAFAALERKGWLGGAKPWRDWSRWKTGEALRAANDGDSEAQNAVADWYERGLSGLSKDDKEALKWHRVAAEAGNVESQLWMSTGMNPDAGPIEELYGDKHLCSDESLKWLRKLAAAGYPDWRWMVGRYVLSRGTPKDREEAAKWFRLGCSETEVNAAIAREQLAEMYERGIGVPRDYEEAARLYRKTAEQSRSPTSEYKLGRMYLSGRGLAKDAAEAAKWFRQAAENVLDYEQGVAQIFLSSMYERGLGVAKDQTAATNLFRKAIEARPKKTYHVVNSDGRNGDDFEEDESEYRKRECGRMARIAWLLATCDDVCIRNGRVAVELAEKIVALDNRGSPNFRNPYWVDVLAAAYAEGGDFSKAVTAEMEAVRLVEAKEKKVMVRQLEQLEMQIHEQQKGEFGSRLKLYMEAKPFREPD